MLSKREVCALLGIGEKALDRLTASGQLPAYKMGKGRTCRVKFREYEVRQFIDSSRVRPQLASAPTGPGRSNPPKDASKEAAPC
jgi:excisionase family DNA binding protein